MKSPMNNNPGLSRFFRARHGSRPACMSQTLNVDMNVSMKVLTGMIILRQDAASPIGSGLISLTQGMFLINLTLAKIFQTQGMVLKLWHD